LRQIARILKNRTGCADRESEEGRGEREEPGPKPGFSQAARPLAGAEVLVALGGPSPESGAGKKLSNPPVSD